MVKKEKRYTEKQWADKLESERDVKRIGRIQSREVSYLTKRGSGTTGAEDFRHYGRKIQLYKHAQKTHPLKTTWGTHRANPKLAKGVLNYGIGEFGMGLGRLKKEKSFRRYRKWKPDIGVNTDWI